MLSAQKITENVAERPVFTCSRKLPCLGYLRQRAVEDESRNARCSRLSYVRSHERGSWVAAVNPNSEKHSVNIAVLRLEMCVFACVLIWSTWPQ